MISNDSSENIEELSELSSLPEAIKIIKSNISLPKTLAKKLLEWSNIKHWLKQPKEIGLKYKEKYFVPYSKTFSLNDSELIALELYSRRGDRTPSTKVRNLILGWLSEQLILIVLNENPFVQRIGFSGVDSQRILQLTRTPTDPDIEVALTNGKVLFIEVGCISKKTPEGKIRIKYNKVLQNEKRFFGRRKSWDKYFLKPTIYISIDMISKTPKAFIIEGVDFYGKKFPYQFPGWENQLVMEFDTINHRIDLDKLKNLNLIKLRDETFNEIIYRHPVMNKFIEKFGNFQDIKDELERKKLEKFANKILNLSQKFEEARKRKILERKEIMDDIKELEKLNLNNETKEIINYLKKFINII